MLDQMRTTMTLKCPNCGASLDISPEMTQFACGYCGSNQVVERKGGTVSLKSITEAVERVQIGTDKTAAELAIPRLQRELANMQSQRQEYERRGRRNIATARISVQPTHGSTAFFWGIVSLLGVVAIALKTFLGFPLQLLLGIGVIASAFLFRVCVKKIPPSESEQQNLARLEQEFLLELGSHDRRIEKKAEELRNARATVES